MMNNRPEVGAAELLLLHEHLGLRMDAFPEALCPRNLREGYSIQDAFAGLWAFPCVGWKVAATSAGGQTILGVNAPLAGRLFADGLYLPGAEVVLPSTAMGVVEVELAFRLCRRIVPRPATWEIEEVLDALGSLHIGIELPLTRWNRVSKVGAPQIAADNACAGPVILGPGLAIEEWRRIDLSAVNARIAVEDAPEAFGQGTNVLGHPLKSLLWLVRNVTGRGITIETGEVILTGSLTPPPSVRRGTKVLAEVSGVGQVRFALA